MSEIDDRRGRAREAAEEGPGDQYTWRDVETAVEVATQVKITDEAIDVVFSARRDSTTPRATERARIALLLATLGFEVIE